MSGPIKPKAHGVLDYGSVALTLAAPALLKLPPAAKTISWAFAGTYLAVSALTDMPLGLSKKIPFPTHGKIELMSAPALLALPYLTGATADPKARNYFLMLFGTVLAAYNLTDWQDKTETTLS